jgi:hypothetical protein
LNQYVHHPARIRVWKWIKQHVLNHAVHGGYRPDAKGESQNGKNGEPGLSEALTAGVAEVADKPLHWYKAIRI